MGPSGLTRRRRSIGEYCGRFGLQKSWVQLRVNHIHEDVALPHHSARQLGFAPGNVFHALFWERGWAWVGVSVWRVAVWSCGGVCVWCLVVCGDVWG